MSVEPNIFDAYGHDFKHDYNSDGDPILSMTCAKCGYVWFPDRTLRQIGHCRG